ncbi:MAG: hypothetical protein U0163_01680, partial [Gemmatimonadaceae bacterium]
MPVHVRRPLWATLTSRRATALAVALAANLLPAAPPAHAATTTFANTTPIIIPATGTGGQGGRPSNPYPSPITVSGVASPITKVTVTLVNYSHGFPDDVGVIVVSPAGKKIRLMSDVGAGPGAANGDVAANLTLTFDDAGPSLPDTSALTSGTFRPTRGNGNAALLEGFPAPE